MDRDIAGVPVPALLTGNEPACPPLDPDGIPSGFLLMPDGIHHEAQPGEAQWICPPLRVTARFRNSANVNWGRIVEVQDPLGNWKSLPVLDCELGSNASAVRSKLQNIGFELPREKGRGEMVSKLIADWKPARMLVTAEHLGWTDNATTGFVLGGGVSVGSTDVLPMGHALSPLAQEIRVRGSLDAWRSTVACKCSGNDLLLVAVSSAFAGPLLEFLDLDLGGGLHLRGVSSCGKSTILRVAASVWGSPELVGSWRATANGLEAAAAASNSMQLVLDELAGIDAKELDKAIYMLANGVAKTRMAPYGTPVAPTRWKLSILSSGEISVADKLAEARRSQMAGQTVRLVDIEADAQAFGAFDTLHGAANGAAFADTLKVAAEQAYGSAGPAFVQLLICNRRIIRSVAGKFFVEFEKQATSQLATGAHGQDKRVIKRFALIALAGLLATKFNLTGWNTTAARDAALSVLNDWQDGQSSQNEGGKQTLEKTKVFLSAHAAQLIHLADPTAPVPINPIGWRDATQVYLPQSTWH
ncbi:MAG: DUF927 domain-containing protein, partial [Pseudomonadota bacterium]